MGITPDIVIHTDPFSLKNLYFERDGQEISQWDEWIEGNDFSDVKYFITSSMGAPDMFGIPAEKILWMSPGQKLEDTFLSMCLRITELEGSVS